MDDSTSEIDKLVLVVHGVGDPLPGETLSVFARSLCEDSAPLLEKQQIRWFQENSHSSDHVKTFASHTRRLKFRGQQLEFAEAYWGDVSRVRKGLLGILQGLFQLLFGLRYVAYMAADQPGRAMVRLKQLGLISSRILRGPVLAVNFFLGILTGALSLPQLIAGNAEDEMVPTHIVLAGCCVIAIVFGTIVRRLTQSRVVEQFCFWVNVTAMFIASLATVKLVWLDAAYPDLVTQNVVQRGLIFYCRILVVLLGMLWFVEILVLVAMAICWIAAMAHPRVYRPALHVAFLLPALVVGIWGQLLPMVWLSTITGLSHVVQYSQYSVIFDEAIPLLGVQLIMVLTIMFMTLAVVYRYFRWRCRATIANFERGQRVPRLIVHPILQSTLAVCTAIGVSLVFTLGFLQLCGSSYHQIWGGELLAETNKIAVIVLVPIGGLIVVIMPHLRPALDIALDVENHFYFRSRLVNDILDDDDEFDLTQTTHASGNLSFSRREVILNRLKRILAHYRDQSIDGVELIIVAHSQGTMVAIEVLNDPDLAWLDNCFSRVSLVTMGSPLAHLYQEYFEHLYPPLHHLMWTNLRAD